VTSQVGGLSEVAEVVVWSGERENVRKDRAEIGLKGREDGRKR